jgi:hypothetical protein
VELLSELGKKYFFTCPRLPDASSIDCSCVRDNACSGCFIFDSLEQSQKDFLDFSIIKKITFDNSSLVAN